METPENVRWWRTSLGDEEMDGIRDALSNGHVSQGEVTRQFERQLADCLEVGESVATTSGSVALLLALWAMEIGPGDEVIIPDRTYAATAHAALMLGAGVVLVDTIPGRPVIDASRVEAALTPKTKAVIAVHLNGRSAEMEPLTALADTHGFFVVEDAAQALFSRCKAGYLGCQGRAGAVSFGMSKLLQTGQGGAVLTSDEHIGRTARLLRNHGVGGDAFDVDYQRLGFNFKFTDIQAAIGIAQLAKAPDRTAVAVRLYHRYEQALRGMSTISLLPVDTTQGEIPLYVEVLCPQRERLIRYLADRGIETRKSLPSLHRSRHINPSGTACFPNSALFEEQAMYLPSGPGQRETDVDRVIDAISSYEEVC